MIYKQYTNASGFSIYQQWTWPENNPIYNRFLEIPRNKPNQSKNLYNENFRTPQKEIEEDTKIWKGVPVVG